MATKKEVLENEEIKAENKASKTKKIATGNTKKVVQKRSSSVAAKAAKTSTTKTKATSTKSEKKLTDAKELKSAKETKKQKLEKEPKPAQELKTTKKQSEENKAKPKETSKAKEEKKTTNSKGGTSKKVTKKPENEKTSTSKKAKEVVNNELIKEVTNEQEIENEEEEDYNDTKKEKALTKKQIEEIKKVVKKEIQANNKIPQEEEQTMLQKLFQNIGLAIMVLVYFNFIVLGFINIQNNVFLTDIKVFSMAMLIIAIGVFEFAYKKESGRYAIHGIEILILAFVTMALLYINLMWQDKFIPIAVFISYVFCIYYVVKSIIIYCKIKKKYTASEIKKMIKK